MGTPNSRLRVIVPTTAGFCFGVERALNLLIQALKRAQEEGKKVFSLGPIIHNEAVIQDLTNRGVEFLRDLNDLKAKVSEGDYLLIRSHGVPKEVMEELKRMKLNLLDGTCPYVKKIHKIVEEASAKGRTVLIFGKPQHPEIIGTKSYAENPIVFSSIDELRDLKLPPRTTPVTLVAQTTELEERYERIKKLLEDMFQDIESHNTICYITHRNQKIAKRLAEISDVVVVIGGKNSSNTRKLKDIAIAEGKKTFHITYPSELSREWFRGDEVVGLLSGASTPKSTVLEVAGELKDWFNAEVLMMNYSGEILAEDEVNFPQESDVSVTT